MVEDPTTDAPGGLIRRPEREADAALMVEIFRAAFGAPFESFDPALRDVLLRQQQVGQMMTYRALFPDACREIVEHDGTPVGRIVLDTGDGAITLVDIALLPSWRGRGIGTALLQDILAWADRPVRLSVMRDNVGARRLYERLGFVAVETTEVEVRMERAKAPSRPVLPQAGDGTTEPRRDFAAFARLLQTDAALVARLRPILERSAFVAAVVDAARARGFVVAAGDVEAALEANKHGWITHWLPVL